MFFNPKKGLTFFQKNILTMLKGTILSQIIGMVGTLYIAKLYGPEAYGLYGLFISICSFISLVNTLQLDNLIIKSKSLYEAKSIMNSVIIVSIVITVIILILGVLGSMKFIITYSSPFIIFISTLTSIIFSLTTVNTSFLIFLKKFKLISRLKVLTISLNIFLQLLFYCFFSINGLIYGYILSIFILLVLQSLLNKKHYQLVSINLLKDIFKKETSIIKYYFPSSLINNLANNITPILFISYFSLSEYGVYQLSIKILSVPIFILSSSITSVYFEKASKIYLLNPIKLYPFTKNIILNNLKIGIAMLILINTVGIYILEIFFDKNWGNIRIIIFLLSFLIGIKLIFIPVSDLVIILKKNKSNLIFNIYLLISSLISIYLGSKFETLIGTIFFISFFGTVGYLMFLLYLLNATRQPAVHLK